MQLTFPLGTVVNTATVIVGSGLGLIIHKGLKDRYREILFHAIGLFTLAIASTMAIEMQNPLIVIGSLALGGLTGEFLRLETRFEKLVDRIKSRFSKPVPDNDSNSPNFTLGLMTAFVLFCIGPMTVVGCIDEGIRDEHTLLLLKALMDGIASLTLATAYGWGVFFSFIPLFLFQFGITLLAWAFQGIFSDVMIAQITGLGGVLTVGVGLGLLGLKKVKLLNLLPSIIYLVVIQLIVARFA